jgi:hypothetical protein
MASWRQQTIALLAPDPKRWRLAGEVFFEIANAIPLHFATRHFIRSQRGVDPYEIDLPSIDHCRWRLFTTWIGPLVERRGSPRKFAPGDRIRLRAHFKHCAKCDGPQYLSGWSPSGGRRKYSCPQCANASTATKPTALLPETAQVSEQLTATFSSKPATVAEALAGYLGLAGRYWSLPPRLVEFTEQVCGLASTLGRASVALERSGVWAPRADWSIGQRGRQSPAGGPGRLVSTGTLSDTGKVESDAPMPSTAADCPAQSLTIVLPIGSLRDKVSVWLGAQAREHVLGSAAETLVHEFNVARGLRTSSKGTRYLRGIVGEFKKGLLAQRKPK